MSSTQTWDDGFDHETMAGLCISQGVSYTGGFVRSDNTKHVHLTLVVPKYGTNPGGQGNAAFQLKLFTPDGVLHSATDTLPSPVKHLSRPSGGLTGQWVYKVIAQSVPNGGCANFALDITEK